MHDCNAYCRPPVHAELIHQWSSAPSEPMMPERWARLWINELRRLGTVLGVSLAREYEVPTRGPEPHHTGAYLVTYEERP